MSLTNGIAVYAPYRSERSVSASKRWTASTSTASGISFPR